MPIPGPVVITRVTTPYSLQPDSC